MSDSSKIPSLNNQSKSNNESTINDDNQVYPNIELKTDPKTDQMIQDTDNLDNPKFRIRNLQKVINLIFNSMNLPQSKSLSIIKDETINTDISDSS